MGGVYQEDVINVARVLLHSKNWASRGIGLVLRIASSSGWPVKADTLTQVLSNEERSIWLQRGWNALAQLAQRSSNALSDEWIHNDGRYALRLFLLCELMIMLLPETKQEESPTHWLMTKYEEKQTYWSTLKQSYQALAFKPEQKIAWKGLNKLLAALLPSGGNATLGMLCDLLEWFTVEKVNSQWTDPVLELNADSCPFIKQAENEKTLVRWQEQYQILQLYQNHPNPAFKSTAKKRIERLQHWGLIATAQQ